MCRKRKYIMYLDFKAIMTRKKIKRIEFNNIRIDSKYF